MTSNPAFSQTDFNTQPRVLTESPMSISGAINKTFALLFCTVFSAIATAYYLPTTPAIAAFVMPAAIIGFVLAMVIIFKKTTAPYLAPVYALAEGVVIGVISAFAEASFPGIVMQAVSLTFLALFSMLFLFKTKMIQATEKFRSTIFIATASIAGLYLISFIGSFFNFRIPFIHESGMVGIGFSVFVVIIASLNFILDFDFIQKGEENMLPKYYEWYGAFGLMITLIWLYLEILRLLAKTRRR